MSKIFLAGWYAKLSGFILDPIFGNFAQISNIPSLHILIESYAHCLDACPEDILGNCFCRFKTSMSSLSRVLYPEPIQEILWATG